MRNQKHFIDYERVKKNFVNATGVGINLDISQTVTSVKGHAKFFSIPKIYGEASDWKVVDLNIWPAISCSLASYANTS